MSLSLDLTLSVGGSVELEVLQLVSPERIIVESVSVSVVL